MSGSNGKDEGNAAGTHPIGVVSERTGLSQEVLRVWERRYGAVRPERAEGGQRLYTDGDVERLQLLRLATQGGRSIGSVAQLPNAELQRLVREDEQARARVAGTEAAAPASLVDLDAAVAHARALDGAALEVLLSRAAAVLGAPHFLERVVAPFMRRVGEEWHAGKLSPAHEHLATATVHRVVVRVLGTLDPNSDGPVFLVAAPAGERHETGALLAAATAAAEGWRVVYLGADLPAGDLAAAAITTGARAVGVSLVYVTDPARTAAELGQIRRGLPASVPLLVGGGGSAAVATVAGGLDVLWVPELEALRSALRRWKAQGPR
jgi:MerR family transcriptional regulator, light-induced transcriptional regulator